MLRQEQLTDKNKNKVYIFLENSCDLYNTNSENARARYYKFSKIKDLIKTYCWILLYNLASGMQYVAYFCKNLHIGLYYMILSELKLLGIYFAYQIKTDYIVTEDIIAEFDKKKHIISKN